MIYLGAMAQSRLLAWEQGCVCFHQRARRFVHYAVPSGASPALLACVASAAVPCMGYIPGESPGAEQLPGAPPPHPLPLPPFFFLLCFLLQGPSLWQHMQLHSDIPSFITAPPPWLHPRPLHHPFLNIRKSFRLLMKSSVCACLPLQTSFHISYSLGLTLQTCLESWWIWRVMAQHCYSLTIIVRGMFENLKIYFVELWICTLTHFHQEGITRLFSLF